MLLLAVALSFGNEPTSTEGMVSDPASGSDWTLREKMQWAEKHDARQRSVTPLAIRSEHVQPFLKDLSGSFVVVNTEIRGLLTVVRVEPGEVWQGSILPNDEVHIHFDMKPHGIPNGSEIAFHAWKMNAHSFTVESNRLYVRQEDDSVWTADKHHLVSVHPYETHPSAGLVSPDDPFYTGPLPPPPVEVIAWPELVEHMRAVTPVGKMIRDEAGL